ncbi:MAG: CDP-alcohol phosphatidyltransferase family protein [Beijerinckiaceae bacterium]
MKTPENHPHKIPKSLIFLKEGTRSFVKARSPICVPQSVSARSPTRIQTSVTAAPERMVLDWLCMRMPSAITPDRLTGIGVAGAVIVFVGYLASRIDPAFFWLATLGLVVHWFGDSLDGSLARYRQIEKPRYGYFLDHSVDTVAIFSIMIGLGLSAYVRLDMALFALLGYFMLCIYVFLSNHVTGQFQLTFLSLGPTEARIGLIGLNSWMYFAGNSKLVIGSESFSSYDLVLFGNGIVCVCVFIVNMVKVVKLLRREDAPRPSREPVRFGKSATPL